MRSVHHRLELTTGKGLSVHNLTEDVRSLVTASGIRDGLVTVTCRHTTTALAVNEDEERLLADIEAFFARLVPADARYLHNDIHLRDCPPDEPENAHAHLAALLLGASESIPLADGELLLGTWQSVLLVELDGPRRRGVGLQIIGE